MAMIYGHLGKLNKRDWKRMLASNEGLFVRMKKAPGYVMGPTLDDSGNVIDDAMTVETTYFVQVASKKQVDFFQELLRTNPVAAQEYVLTVSGSIKRWKKDVKWLELALNYFEKEISFLRRERNLLARDKQIAEATVRLPEVLMRHFPHLFKEINVANLSFENLIKQIKSIEKEAKAEEGYLRKYLDKLKHEMPFLF